MALTRSFPTQHPSGLPITDTRRVASGLVARNADGTPRPGIIPSNSNPLVTGRASMGYDVAPFVAATSRVNTGVELIANDAVTTVATTPAPAANSRIDVIWVRSQFVQHTDANNDVVFGVTQGTAQGVPSKPTIPAGALELATATILSSTTTTATVVITQTHQYTAASGGVVWLRNQAQQDAWSAPNGTRALRIDLGAYVDRVDGAWATVEPGSYVVRPASVAGSGVTIGADGYVNFAGSNSIVVNGAFTARFNRYRIDFVVDSATADADMLMALRNSGTAVGPTAHSWVATQVQNTQGPVRSEGIDGATVRLGRVASLGSFSFLEISNPGHALTKMGKFGSVDSGLYSREGAVKISVLSAADGFTITATNGSNLTGRIRIVGLV